MMSPLRWSTEGGSHDSSTLLELGVVALTPCGAPVGTENRKKFNQNYVFCTCTYHLVEVVMVHGIHMVLHQL